jgi:hypothetical protein
VGQGVDTKKEAPLACGKTPTVVVHVRKLQGCASTSMRKDHMEVLYYSTGSTGCADTSRVCCGPTWGGRLFPSASRYLA